MDFFNLAKAIIGWADREALEEKSLKYYYSKIHEDNDLPKDILDAIETKDIIILFFARGTGVCDEIIWYRGEFNRDNLKVHLFEENESLSEIEDNTEELSKFTSNNYKMRIYRYYQKVYMDLRCHEEKKNSYKKERIFLGEYDSNIEEDTIDEDDQTTYCPNGCDIQIVVKNYAYGYTIKVGTKFIKDFNYYSK